MKIGFDLRLAALPGGGRVYAQRLFTDLVQLHPDLQFELFYNPDCPVQKNLIEQTQAAATPSRFDLIPIHARSLSLKQHIAFRRYQSKSDLYHYLHFDMPISMSDVPLVMTIHDLYPLSIPGYCSLPKQHYFKRLTRYNARRAEAVITISQYSKQEIINHLGIPEEKITVIHQGVSDQYHVIDDSDHLSQTKQHYQLPDTFLFYTGNHKKHKNLERLFHAYAKLDETVQQQFPLILTGRESEETQALKVLAYELKITPHVHFLGMVDQDDLPALYNLASLIIHPSLYEGFGYLPLEAMRCGTPVVSSNTTAMPEVVGDAGRLFDPYNIDEMTNAIQTAIDNDINNDELKERIVQHASQFTSARCAQNTYNLYQAIANRP